MKRIMLAGLLLLGLAGAVSAQSSPGLVFGQVPTAAQWNSYFAAKQNTLGYSPVNKAGDVMTGKLVTAASATVQAGLNLPAGAAPTSPINGDTWTTTAGLFVRINGVTVGPLVSSASFSLAIGATGITGGGTTRVLYDNAGVLGEYTISGNGTVVAMATSPSLVTPALGVATGTSLALGGATLGGNALAVTGTSLFNSGITMGAALTYGGVTLSNSVTGTGPMVLATSSSIVTASITGTSSFSIRNGSGFDTFIASGGTQSANRTLTINLNNLATALTTNGNISFGGNFSTANNVTLPAIAQGDIWYGSAAGTMSSLADVATGNALLSGGVGAAPLYGKIGLTTHVSGVLSIANGGTNASGAGGTAFDNITGFATNGIISRTGSGTYSLSSISTLLDAIGSTRGSIVYRGSSGWTIAVPTTAGQVWTSNGVGADPTYQPVSGTGTVTNINCAGTAITTTGNCIGTLVNVQYFFTPGTPTYTRGANVTHALGACVGAGGGGGGVPNSSASQIVVGGAGGGGGFAMDYIVPSSTETITVPSGGAGGGAGSSPGTAGGNASIGTKVVATGGNGGSTSSSAAVSTVQGALGGATAGMTGSSKVAGGVGSAGWGSFTLGLIVGGGGGNGAGWFGGGGAQANISASGAGSNAAGIGGGGGGGASYNGGGVQAGGNGFQGGCAILEYM